MINLIYQLLLLLLWFPMGHKNKPTGIMIKQSENYNDYQRAYRKLKRRKK